MDSVKKITVGLVVNLFVLCCSSNEVFTVNDITYTVVTDRMVTWYEAYRKCIDNTDGTYRYMAEFPDFSDWDDVADELSRDDFWIGLVAIDDKAWWTSGRELLESDIDDSHWKSSLRPLHNYYSNSQCTKTIRNGNRYKLDLKDCDSLNFPFCQNKIKAPESSFRLGSSNVFISVDDREVDSTTANAFCENSGSTLAILNEQSTNEAIYDNLITYDLPSDETFFHIGLKVQNGARVWVDGGTLGFSALSLIDNGDLSLDCVVLDTTAASHLSSWKTQHCTDLAKTVCTGSTAIFGGEFYHFIDDKKNYAEAISHCNSISGQLVTVADAAIQGFLYSIVSYGNSPTYWWIGLNNHKGGWEWENGRDLEYNEWGSNYDASGSRCVALDGSDDYLWVPLSNCNELAAFICQSETIVQATTEAPTTTQTTTEALTTTKTTTEVPTTIQATTGFRIQLPTTTQTTTEVTSTTQTITEAATTQSALDATKWINLKESRVFPDSSSAVWNSANDDVNINKVLFSFPTWLSVLKIAITLSMETVLRSFYLESSTDFQQAHSSNWTNLHTSFIPESFEIAFNTSSSASTNQRLTFDVQSQVYTKYFVLSVNDTANGSTIQIEDLEIYGENITAMNCFFHFLNTSISTSSDQAFNTESEAQNECFEATSPCTGYEWNGTVYRVTNSQNSLQENQAGKIAYLNNCRDITPQFLIIATSNNEQRFFKAGAALRGDWFPVQSEFNFILPYYRLPPQRYSKYLHLRGCAPNHARSDEIHRLSQNTCTDNEVVSFYVSDSSDQKRLRYSEETSSPHDGFLSINASDPTTYQHQFDVYVDHITAVDYQFSSLLMENGFYSLSATSRQSGHNENHARRGEIWKGWKPDDSDANPYLSIDLEQTRRLSGVMIEQCSATELIGNFQLLYATHDHPSKFSIIRNGNGDQTFTVDVGLLKQEKILLFIFQQTLSAQHLRFLPDLASLSSSPGTKPCVKLELFGHPEPEQEAGFREISAFELGVNATENHGKMFEFSLILATATQDACFAVFFGDDARRVMFRGSVNVCSDHFDSVSGESNDFRVAHEKSMSFSHWFSTGSGVYNVKAAYYDGTNAIFFDDVLTIDMGSFATVDSLNSGSVIEGISEINITLQLSSVFSPLCGVLDFGDGTTQTLFLRTLNSSECKSKLNVQSSNFENLQVEAGDSSLTIDHRYSSIDNFTIHVTYYNGTSKISNNPSESIEVRFVDCDVEFLLENIGNNKTFYKSDAISLLSYLDVNCENTLYSKSDLSISLRWFSFSCVSETKLSDFQQFSGVSARFPANSLVYGCNAIRIKLSIYNPSLDVQRNFVSQKHIFIQPSPLSVQITGGMRRTVSNSQDYEVDAEANSYDPDSQSTRLQYRFDYQLNPNGAILTIGNDSVVEKTPVRLAGTNNGILHLSLPHGDVGQVVTVTVHVSGTLGRTGSFTQTITLTDADPPQVEIRCVRNCYQGFVNPFQSCVLGIFFLEEKQGLYEYQWSVTDANLVEIDSSSLDTTTRYFEIPANYFSQGAYDVNCHVTSLSTGGVAEASFRLNTETQPYGGRCVVSPTSGFSLRTKFIFQCDNWLSNGCDLTYYIYLVQSNFSLVLLKYTHAQEAMPTLLPAGNANNFFNIQVLVKICKLVTLCSNTTLTVEVHPPSENDQIEAFQSLSVAATTLDVSYLSQVASSMLSESNGGGLQSTDVEARTAIIDSLEKMVKSGVQSPNDLTMMTDITVEATKSTCNLSLATLTSGSSIVEALGSNLRDFALHNDESVSTDMVLSSSEGLVQAASNILDASHASTTALREELLQPQFEQPKPEPDEVNDLSPRDVYYNTKHNSQIQQLENAKTLEDRKAIVGNSVGGTRAIASAMTELKLSVSNNVQSVHTDDLDVSVVTMGSLNSSLAVESTGAKVEFSSAEMEQDVKIVSLKSNPFSFDDSSSLIGSSVVQIDSTSDSQNGLTIILKNPSNAVKFESFNVQNGRISVSRFEITASHYNFLTYITPPEENVQMRVWIRKDKQPLIVGYTDDPELKEDVTDHKFTLPVPGTSSEAKYKIFISSDSLNGVGTYFLSILTSSNDTSIIRARRSTNSSTDANSTTPNVVTLSVAMFTPNCMTLDKHTGQWSSSACKTLPSTAATETICKCDNMAQAPFVAAQFNPAPNFIDFSSVFSKIDLLNNGAVFFTIAALLVIFFLLLLWTRREDKKDMIRWSTKNLISNSASDGYHYKISVVTGLGQNSGTLSNVFFLLAGENAQTSVKEFKDASGKHWFERGSIVHFLMSNPRCLGNLDYLQIWHDNSGPGRNSGNWFLSEVIVHDLHSDKIYFFTCNDWFAIERGDGAIRRTLPVAGDENLKTYKHVFKSTARDKLVNDYLWFSIFATRNKSNFTRCQRVACAASALFLAMISNAMFYRDTQTSEEGQSSNIEIGPLVIDPWTFYVSTVSALIVLFPSVLLIQLFRRTERSKRSNEVQNISAQSTSIALSDSKSRKLPYWCVYVGWIICAIALLASGFFTILYSFQWGKEKSEKWLTSVMLSFAEDSVFMQPLKILVIAAVFATIFRRSADLVKNWKEQNNDEIVLVTTTTEEEEETVPSGEELLPEAEIDESEETSTLCKLRRWRILEKDAVAHIKDFLIYIFYIVVLFYIAYTGHQDSDYFRKISQLHHILDTEAFQSINSFEDYWKYLEVSLLPSMYSNMKYNGDRKKWRERVYIDDDANYRVGPIRLRQLRMVESKCDSERLLLNTSWTSCVPPYVVFNEDTRPYSVGWSLFNDSLDEDLESSYWIYQDSSVTKSGVVVGSAALPTLYAGGGYVVDLGNSLEFSQRTVQYLRENLWLDRYTRALFIEFTIYNANINLFSTTLLLAEFLPTSGFIATPHFLPFRLYLGDNSMDLLVASIVAAVLILYYIGQTISQLVTTKKKFFKRMWNYFGILRIILFIAYIGMFLHSFLVQTDTVAVFQENTYAFTNFHGLATINSGLRQLVGVILFFETVQILEFFKYQKQMRKFSLFFYRGRKLIAEFFGLFVLNLLAFIFISMAMFSAFSKDFYTFIKSFLTLVGAILGHPTYTDLSQMSPVFGQLFFFVFNLQVTYLMLNFLVGVIDVMLHAASVEFSENVDGKDLYFQIVWNLILNWFRRLFKLDEKDLDSFKQDHCVEDELSEEEEECQDEVDSLMNVTKRRQNQAKMKRRKRKCKNTRRDLIKQASVNYSRRVSIVAQAIFNENADDNPQLACQRLKVLEMVVDSIDLNLFESMNKSRHSAQLKRKYADVAMEEIDNVLEEIANLMKID